MELELKKEETWSHPQWAREEVLGPDLTIGTVAASVSKASLSVNSVSLTWLSVEYFGSRRHRKYWTILALLPTSLPLQNKKVAPQSKAVSGVL